MKKFIFLTITLIGLTLPTSCLKQEKVPKIPGLDGPKFNVMEGKIILTMGLENINLPAGVSMQIPKMENSNFTIAPRLGGGTLIQIYFDPNDMQSDHFNIVPRQTLPDGRPFPFLMGGELPALAVQIPKLYNSTFYLSKKVFGVFVPLKIPKAFVTDIHYRIVINKKSIGVVSLIHPDEFGEGSGVILLLTMEQITNNPEIQDFLKFSEKVENHVF
jgi:hypothetical protein